MASKKDLLKQIDDAFSRIAEFEAKYGTTQGKREDNKELFWYGTSNPDTFSDDSDFIVKDMTRSELLFARFIKVWKELNRTAFGEEWRGDVITKAFKDRVEARLFEGQVAAFKHPITGNLVVENFTYNNKLINVETNLPNEIEIISENDSINGLRLQIKDCAIGFNSSTRTSELAYDMSSLEMIVNSYMAMALTIRRSKPKTLIAGMDDDTLAYDVKRAIESDNWVEFLNISAKQLQQLDIRFENGFKDKMEMVMGAVSDFIKFKGFNTNGLILKRERQSESELDNHDEFKHFLIYNKIMERKEMAQQIKNKLGFDVEYDGEELLQLIKGGPECQDNEVDKKTQDKE